MIFVLQSGEGVRRLAGELRQDARISTRKGRVNKRRRIVKARHRKPQVGSARGQSFVEDETEKEGDF